MNAEVENMDITVEDIDRAVLLFGELIPSLHGKFKRPTPKSHGKENKVDLDQFPKGTKIE